MWMTQGPRSPRVALVALIAGVLAGCVTLTPQQQETLDDVRRFADATAAAYDVPRIRVNVEPGTNLGIGGRYRQGDLYLNVGLNHSPHPNSPGGHQVAAHVLGHHVPGARRSQDQVPPAP